MRLFCGLGWHKWEGDKCKCCGKIRNKRYSKEVSGQQNSTAAASVNTPDSIVHYASEGAWEDVSRLIDLGQDVNIRRYDGATALSIASEMGRLNEVNQLIRANADVNIKDSNSITALWYATQEGHVEIVRSLLAAKADVNIKDRNDRTPLFIASSTAFRKFHDYATFLFVARGLPV